MRILIEMGEDVLARTAEPVAVLAPVVAEHDVLLVHEGRGRVRDELELELRNALPERDVVSLQTQVVVAGGKPQAVAEVRSLRTLLDSGAVVICTGQDRLPVTLDQQGMMRETRAPVDRDLISALLARRLDADLLLILGEYYPPPPPQMSAATHFAETTGRRAVLGQLGDVAQMVRGEAGMQVVAPTT